MGQLIDDQIILNKRRDAANIIETLYTMETQWSQTNTAIQALKAKMAVDIPNNVWIKQDFKDGASLLEIRDGIIAKRAAYKAALIILKTQMNNIAYEAEIQIEIDKL